MKGIAGGLQIKGQGTVNYEVVNHHGVLQTILGSGLLIEDLPCKLIPPQCVMLNNDNGYYKINRARAKFVFANNNGEVETPISQSTNLPTITMFRDVKSSSERMAVAMYLCVVNENNQNLLPAAKETLWWHFCLGHQGMAVIQWLSNQKLLGQFSNQIGKIQDCPKCGMCQYSKQT